MKHSNELAAAAGLGLVLTAGACGMHITNEPEPATQPGAGVQPGIVQSNRFVNGKDTLTVLFGSDGAVISLACKGDTLTEVVEPDSKPRTVGHSAACAIKHTLSSKHPMFADGTPVTVNFTSSGSIIAKVPKRAFVQP